MTQIDAQPEESEEARMAAEWASLAGDNGGSDVPSGFGDIGGSTRALNQDEIDRILLGSMENAEQYMHPIEGRILDETIPEHYEGKRIIWEQACVEFTSEEIRSIFRPHLAEAYKSKCSNLDTVIARVMVEPVALTGAVRVWFEIDGD